MQFSGFGVLRDFLHQFIRRVLYPFGRDLRLSQTSGMASTTTSVGRVRSSYIRRGKGLANSRPSAELRGSLDEGDRILEGFYVSRADGTLQLLIFTAPIQLNVVVFGKYIFTKNNNSKSGTRSGTRHQESGTRSGTRNQETGMRSGTSPKLRVTARLQG